MSSHKTPNDPAAVLYTIDQTAALTNFSRSYVKILIGQGDLSVVRFGRAVRIKPESIHALISRQG